MRKTIYKFGIVFMICGALLILAALTLIAYNIWDEHRAALLVADTLKKFELSDAADEQMIPDYIIDPSIDMPTECIDGREYIGVLSIPALGLDLPIMAEWSYSNLKNAPCRYDGSVYLDNMIIAGHNYKSHFSALKNLSIGERILFTDNDGNKFEYAVKMIETLQPTDIEAMCSGEWDLTLFTCTYGGKSRVTVRCTRL